MGKSEKYYVYIILCENNSYYTGITNNLINRFNEHLRGKGANYTKIYRPIKFLSVWEVSNISIALKIEHYIKSKNKKTKSLFIENNRLLKNYYIRDNKCLSYKISIRSFSNKCIDKINSNIN